MLVFDITNQKSFDSITSWMQDIETVGKNNIVCIK